jgi:putative NIF3 family GTP cyclohydrolase 1 type 2
VQIASATSEVKTLCVALDPSVDTVRRAVDLQKADFLLCHHPLTLSPRLPSRLDDLPSGPEAEPGFRMWIYSAHTSLDANPEGPVNWLGRALGLQDMRILEVTRGKRLRSSACRDPERADALQGFRRAITHRDAQTAEYLLWPEDRR